MKRHSFEDYQAAKREREQAAAHTTPGDEEQKRTILANGIEALRRIHGDQTWEDWMTLGAALDVITEDACLGVGAVRWDKDNKRLVKAFNASWEDYERRAGDQKALTKQERWALREVRSDPKYGIWRSEVGKKDPARMRRMNHPNAVINGYKAAHRAIDPYRPPSPMAQLKRANIELQEENEQLKQREDGDRFKPTDTADDIAETLVGMFSASKATDIANRMLAKLKERGTKKAARRGGKHEESKQKAAPKTAVETEAMTES
jgi:hypothetical protein